MSDVSASKWLSYVLRHDPASAGLTMDEGGWVEVAALLEASPHLGDRAALERVVAENAKQRFALSEDGLWIRARQGHLIAVDLGLVARDPPETLFHGTAERFLPSIRESGLEKRSRQHVHLSKDRETALAVGRRHGAPVVLAVAAGRMAADGCRFYLSENGVWLTERVPVGYVSKS